MIRSIGRVLIAVALGLVVPVAGLAAAPAITDIGAVEIAPRDNGLPKDWQRKGVFVEILVRAFAPILSFTADEIWSYLPARAHDSALFATWADLDGIAALSLDGPAQSLMDDLFALRAAALKRIEALRTDGAVGGSLEAVVRLFPATDAHRARAAEVEPELRFFFITSDVRLERVGTDLPPTTGETALDGAFHVFVEATHDPKCVRCWHHRPDVGTHASHPELCGRCVANVDGPGEVRHWF